MFKGAFKTAFLLGAAYVVVSSLPDIAELVVFQLRGKPEDRVAFDFGSDARPTDLSLDETRLYNLAGAMLQLLGVGSAVMRDSTASSLLSLTAAGADVTTSGVLSANASIGTIQVATLLSVVALASIAVTSPIVSFDASGVVTGPTPLLPNSLATKAYVDAAITAALS